MSKMDFSNNSYLHFSLNLLINPYFLISVSFIFTILTRENVNAPKTIKVKGESKVMTR